MCFNIAYDHLFQLFVLGKGKVGNLHAPIREYPRNDVALSDTKLASLTKTLNASSNKMGIMLQGVFFLHHDSQERSWELSRSESRISECATKK